MPEVCIKATIINFTVTPKGLEDQLLVDVVKYEKPELEREKDKLIVDLDKQRKGLKETEEKILQQVNSAGADILEDEGLINNLDEAKEKSIVVKEKVSKGEEKEKEINIQREK